MCVSIVSNELGVVVKQETEKRNETRHAYLRMRNRFPEPLIYILARSIYSPRIRVDLLRSTRCACYGSGLLLHIISGRSVKRFGEIWRIGIICLSRQRVRPYLVFVTTQASLLVKKAV